MMPSSHFFTLMAKTSRLGYHGDPLPARTPDPNASSIEITQLLSRMSDGNADARNQVWELLHSQLRQSAGSVAKGANGLFQATELISIAFTKVDRLEGKDWSSRRHFVAVAALAMRSAVVDRLRQVGTKGEGTPLDEVVQDVAARVDGDVLGFYDELDLFAKTDPLMAHALELKALGYGAEQIAAHLDMPERSFYRRFERARAYLQARLQ